MNLKLVVCWNEQYGIPALQDLINALEFPWVSITAITHTVVPSRKRRLLGFIRGKYFSRDSDFTYRGSIPFKSINIYGQDYSAIKGQLPEEYHLLCCGFNRIFEAEWLSDAKTAVNVHPSLLPWYRGPDPISWVWHFKEKVTGVTLHRMTDKVDVGQTLLRGEVKVESCTNRAEVAELLKNEVRLLTKDYLKSLSLGQERVPLSPLSKNPYNNDIRYKSFYRKAKLD